jgi:rSAM/selenodomain-associated transferase 2
MNAGAHVAQGHWLLFLHADSRLPEGWLDAVRRAADDPAVAGGWFRLQIGADQWQARVIEQLAALRVALFGLAYGDQGLFVRREVFTRMGGYRILPLMEDVDFVRRLAREGTLFRPALAITTSARRWERDGWMRRSLSNVTLLILYQLGVPPARLARWY